MGASGFGTEAATEAWQTHAEGKAKLEAVTGADIFAGAVIGGVAGGGISAGGRSIAELAGSTPEKAAIQKQEAEKRVVFDEAVAANDTTGYMDPATPAYDPAKAVGVLMGHSQRADTQPEVKTENLTKATQIVSDLATQRDTLKAAYDNNVSTTPAEAAEAIVSLKEAVAATDPKDTAKVEKLNTAIAEYEAAVTGSDPKALRIQQAELGKMDRQLETARKSKDELGLLVQPSAVDMATQVELVDAPQNSNAASSTAVDKVINLSMASPESLSFESATQLAGNAGNSLTAPQRTYLNAFAEGRKAETELRGMGGVSEQIYFGNKENMGIAQYQARMSEAVSLGNQAVAQKQVDGLSRFATQHAEKATRLVAEGDKHSPRLVATVKKESAALAKAAAGLQATFDLKFSVPVTPQKGNPDVAQARTAPQSPAKAAGTQAPGVEAAPADLPSPARNTAGTSAVEAAGLKDFKVKVDKYADYLRNPPKDYTTAQAQKIVEWSKKQMERLTTEIAATQDEDRAEQLDDLRSTLKYMVKDGSASIQADLELDAMYPEKAADKAGVESSSSPAPSNNLSKKTVEVEERAEQVLPSPEETKPLPITEEVQDTGGLAVLENATEQVPSGTKLGAVYRSINKAVAFLIQKRVKVTKDSDIDQVKPLVEVTDFLARWNAKEAVPADFLGDVLSDDQRYALKKFKDFANKWLPVVQKGFIKGSLPNSLGNKVRADFLFTDPVQDFVNEDGTIDENISTAVIYAAYSWLLDSMRSPARLDAEQILGMHGLDEDSNELTGKGRSVMAQYSAMENTVVSGLGDRLVSVLGIQAKPGAPIDYLPKVSAAFGVHALQMLAKTGLVQIDTLSGSTLMDYMPDLTFKPTVTVNYVKLKRGTYEEKYALPDAGKTLLDSAQGSMAVVDKLFGSERAPSEASWTPIPFKQAKAKGTDQNVSKEQLAILKEANSHEHRIIPAMWNTLNVLGKDAVLKAAGWKAYDETKIQKDNRESVQAQNENLEKQLEAMTDLVQHAEANSELGLTQPFFANNEVWRNFRVGITTQNLNVQSSKIHRFMFFRPEWESTIALDDQSAVDQFLTGVALAFGINIDKQPRVETLEKLNALLLENDGHLLNLASMLHEANVDPENSILTNKEKEDISAFAADNEGMMTLQALVAYGNYMNELGKGAAAKEFTVHMLIGVDGKTNGPMLSQLALGAAESVTGLFKRLNMGGMFQESDGFNNFNHWYKDVKHLDLYEDLARVVLGKLKGSKADLEAFYTITKELLTVKGDVTSAGRKLVKTPLTAFNFGSSKEGAVLSMNKAFIQAVSDRIEAVATKVDTGVSLAKLITSINQLIGLGSFDKALLIPANATIENLMDMEMSKPQKAALGAAFDHLMKKPVEDSMKTYFEVFSQRRKSITGAVSTVFTVYSTVFESLKSAEIQRLIEAGEISFTEDTKGNKSPDHDLTKAQMKALREKVAKLLPRAHTAYTVATDEIDAGLYMAKTSKGVGKESMHEVQVQMNEGVTNAAGKRITSVRAKSMVKTEVDPGVAAMAYFMHSLDSAVMHRALKGTQALNVHDEKANGAGRVVETAKRINEKLFDTMLGFSPSVEAYRMVEQSVVNLQKLVEGGEIDAEVLQDILAKFKAHIPYSVRSGKVALKDSEIISLALGFAKNEMYQGELIRLETLSLMTSLDQYTWEGGEYRVTEANRKEAADQLAALRKQTAQVAPEVLTAAVALSTLAATQKNKPVAKEEAPQKLTNAVLGVNAVTAPDVAALAAKSVGNGKEVVKVVTLVQQGTSLSDAIDLMEDGPEKAAFIQAVAWTADARSPAQSSPWGVLGTAKIDSDPELVAMFEAKPVMSGKEVLKEIRNLLLTNGKATGANKAQYSLINRLYNLLPDDLMVTYVTPATAADAVLEKPATVSRGWYVAKGSQDGVYILSTEHKNSGLNAELLVHELLHAALSHTIQFELDGKTLNPDYRSAASELVQELESLRQEAIKYAAKYDLAKKFAPALVDIHELVSWGMSNREFQAEVLTKISMKSKTKGNVLVSGMKKFIDSLVGFLFKHAEAREQELATNGLSLLISNVSGLFEQSARRNEQEKAQAATLNFSMSSADKISSYTTTELFDELAQGNTSSTFNTSLRNLLGGIVDKLHGTYGSFKEGLMANQTLSAVDVFAKALDTGVAPFASKALAAGLLFSDREAFVLEQVEVTVRAALDGHDGSTYAVYTTLNKLYDEMRAKIKPADFHQGDWAKATVSEKEDATALYDFIFKLEKSGAGSDRTDHLSRFAAMGLTHEGFNKLLQVPTTRNDKTMVDMKTFGDKLKYVFDQLLEILNGKLTRTTTGQQADLKLEALVNQLVGIESKKRALLNRKSLNLVGPVEDAALALMDGARAKVSEFAGSDFFRNSTNGFVALAGTTARAISEDRTAQLLDTLTKYRDAHFKGKQGLIASLISNVRGLPENFQELLRSTKHNEKTRKQIISGVSKIASEGFINQGKQLLKAEKAAVSAVFLRTGAFALLGKFDMSQLQNLLTDRSELDKAIADYEGKLAPYSADYQAFFKDQATFLAYQMATGRVKGKILMHNAGNIARLYGTGITSRLNDAQTLQAEADLDVLVTLYALSYSASVHLQHASRVLTAENARTDNAGNGVEALLHQHQALEKQAQERLFQGSDALMRKGYSPEIYNPYVDIKAAHVGDEANALLDMGYVEGKDVKSDPDDPDQDQKRLYVMRDGGHTAYLTGIASLSGMRAKGTTLHHGNTSMFTAAGQQNLANMQAMKQARKADIAAMFTAGKTRVDPALIKENYQSPVLNARGEIANWAYLMNESTKDSLLERNNDFGEILGTLAGSTFDKENTAEQNHKLVVTLKDMFDTNFAGNENSYMKVSENSPDVEMREIYRMLPEVTKQSIREVWGRDGMQVRVDVLDISFGYRKLSAAAAFDKKADSRTMKEIAAGVEKREGERSVVETAFVLFTEFALENYARGRKTVARTPEQRALYDDPEKYVKRAAMIVRKNERIWQEIVKEMKDIIVVKTGTVMLGNILSNVNLLWIKGIPMSSILRDHRVAMKGAMAYQRDSAELFRLKTQLDMGYVTGDIAETRREVIRLEDSLERNPVRVLIDAGLMPSIVEDVSGDEDIYSYKSQYSRKLEQYTSKLNPSVVSAARTVYMAHDTTVYKTMSQLTQLSDFVARYTLYQHLTIRAKNPLSSADAIQDASETFVNYDIPMYRGLQYTDDMGITLFTKYFLRIQSVILKLGREQPARVLAMMLMNGFTNVLPNVLDSSVMNRIGSNPLGVGALSFPSTLDELATIHAGVGIFK